jgi:hypothetical protein
MDSALNSVLCNAKVSIIRQRKLLNEKITSHHLHKKKNNVGGLYSVYLSLR